MRFQFDDTPIHVKDLDGDLIAVGTFEGEFEINEIGSIDIIRLREHAWPNTNREVTLRRWRPGDKPPSFKTHLFDALAKTLERKWEDEINETLANYYRGDSDVTEIEHDRAVYHQSVL